MPSDAPSNAADRARVHDGAAGPDGGVGAVLRTVVAALPGGGEARPGQDTMAGAVADAVRRRRHLVVQAGTGTGKTLAYLVPAVAAGRRTVVATATRALQDQLATKDLPFLARTLDRPFSWAVLKGRSNYVCRQRVAELAGDGDQLALDGLADRAGPAELRALVRFAEGSATGDRAELDHEPSEAAWAAVSVGARECPGASRCPAGGSCFAEAARRRAAEADVTVVNLHLYALDLASDGAVLPEHELVVIDEAHQLEDVVASVAGVELGAGRFIDLARRCRGVVADDRLGAGVDDAGRLWRDALAAHLDRRLTELPDDVAGVVSVVRSRVEQVVAAARAVPDDAPPDAKAKAARLMRAATSLIDDLDALGRVGADEVAWVEGAPATPRLRIAPVDVAPLLTAGLWQQRTAVLTSATLPPGVTRRLGLTDATADVLDVGSPFDYGAQGLLYCAAHLPDPRHPGYDDALLDELAGLVEAAGGRTLALFTSFRAMDRAAEGVRDRTGLTVLTQRDLPKPRLLERFTAEPSTCLFATLGFWQGVDVPGAACTLVAIDRLPFPRPDEPLLQARRERAGPAAFELVDLPRAAVLLAQGAGRLIRTATDRGVVAVLDPRLARARYRWELVNALPPMRRTRDPAEARALLRALNTPVAAGPPGVTASPCPP